jgi:hypothetical protein
MPCEQTAIAGGYTLVRAATLLNLLAAMQTKQLSFRSARTFVACLSMKAARDGAFAAEQKVKGVTADKRVPQYTFEEIHRYIGGVGGQYVREDITSLEQEELLTFCSHHIALNDTLTEEGRDLIERTGCSRSPKRFIPVPRRILAFLCCESRPSLFKATIGFLLRGLSLKRGGAINEKGTMKAGFLACLTGISLRAAKAARKALIALGWLNEDTSSTQRKLNRTGAYFVINIGWKNKQKQSSEPCNGTTRSSFVGKLLHKTKSKNAPPQHFSTGDFAPPYKDKDLPKGTKKDQKLDEASRSGVSRNTPSDPNQDSRGESVLPPPSFRNILYADLKHIERIMTLYEQASASGVVKPSEAMLINFVAAAVRAVEVSSGESSVRIFRALVVKKMWGYVTHEQENQAVAMLKQHRNRMQTKIFQKIFSQGALFHGTKTL